MSVFSVGVFFCFSGDIYEISFESQRQSCAENSRAHFAACRPYLFHSYGSRSVFLQDVAGAAGYKEYGAQRKGCRKTCRYENCKPYQSGNAAASFQADRRNAFNKYERKQSVYCRIPQAA